MIMTGSPRRTRRPMPPIHVARAARRGWLVAPLAIVFVTVVSACSAPTEPDEQPPSAAVDAFGHVHGLGVDELSGQAFAATHAGVFALPPLDSDTVSVADLDGPIAGLAQDTMGFTMAGAIMFGSGHPDPVADPDLTPPVLGLITSSDSAETWEPVSLRGEVDFHDLAVATDGATTRIYGYNGSTGTVMASHDGGATWTAGETIAARDLSVDPAEPDTVYATTADGLAVSTDAAANFSLVADAPPLFLLDDLDDASGGLVGVTVDGSVWVREGNEPFSRTGSAGADVEALVYTSAPESRLIVASRAGVRVSNDLGATWRDLVVATG